MELSLRFQIVGYGYLVIVVQRQALAIVVRIEIDASDFRCHRFGGVVRWYEIDANGLTACQVDGEVNNMLL